MKNRYPVFAFSLSILFGIGCAPTENASETKERIDNSNNPLIVVNNDEAKMNGKLDELATSGRVSSWWEFQDWFPYNEDGVAKARPGGSATEKYDRAFNNGQDLATQWEKKNHGTMDGTHPSWYGHCNGLAATIATTPYPVKAVEYNGVSFSSFDMIALMVEANQGTRAGISGERCNVVNPGVDSHGRLVEKECRDLNAGSFHLVLANLISQNKMPIIDFVSAHEVWNFPIVEFSSSIEDVSVAEANRLISDGMVGDTEYSFANAKAKSFQKVQTSISYINGRLQTKVYDYILEISANGIVTGGEWLGASKQSHPDFIWYPLEPDFSNPYVDFFKVKKLILQSIK